MIPSLFTLYIFCSVIVYADDYSFDMESIQTKSFEYSGYLRTEYKHQNLNVDSPLYTFLNRNDSTQSTSLNEALFRFTHYKDDFKDIGSLVGKIHKH